jgi:hypothetical protein
MKWNGSDRAMYQHLLARALDRNTALEELVQELYLRLEDERTLLRSALHELAAARGARSTSNFVAAWYRERRVRL